MRANDELNDPQQMDRVRTEARRVLEHADAFGRFPTPIDEIIQAAQYTVIAGQDIDEGFLAKACRKISGALKSAMSKVWGVLDIGAQIMHLDRAVHAAKVPFLKLHELAHGWMPWQRDLYAITADCEQHLDPDISDAFERQANAFASEVIFQLDAFAIEAADHPFELRTPLKLAKKYGGSLYSTIRRYVRTNDRICAVAVLEPPVMCPGHGFTARVRRVIASNEFTARFGSIRLPDVVTPDDSIGKMVPVGEKQKMSRPREITFTDQNGACHECIAEAFKYKYHIFVLICHHSALRRRAVLVTP